MYTTATTCLYEILDNIYSKKLHLWGSQSRVQWKSHHWIINIYCGVCLQNVCHWKW